MKNLEMNLIMSKLNDFIDKSIFVRLYEESIDEIKLLNDYKNVLNHIKCKDIHELLKMYEFPNPNTSFRIHGFIPEHNDDTSKMIIRPKEMRFMTSKTLLKDEFSNIEFYMNQRYLYDNIKIKRNLIPREYTGEILIPIYNDSKKELVIINDELKYHSKAKETVNQIIIPSYRIETNVTIVNI